MKYKRQLAFICFFLLVIFASSFSVRDSLPAVSEVSGVELPVIMYHQVLDSPKKLGKYVISTYELESDLRLLSELGYETVTVGDVIDFCDGKRNLPRKPVMLTFDDGYRTDYLNVFPLLKKYNMSAVFSVVGAYTERYSTPGIDRHINYAHLSWDEIREMEESGLCEFQNHSYNLHSLDGRHGCLPINGESEEHYRAMIGNDMKLSRELLRENLKKEPLCFTYPYGGTNDDLRKIVKEEGFRASLGTYEKVNILTGNPEELYDIRRFNRAHGRDVGEILRLRA